ncbi:MAG: IS630 family transposase [Desulfovibrio sp.]|nr:IS630 family transposase [Desulfovibrio sp.]
MERRNQAQIEKDNEIAKQMEGVIVTFQSGVLKNFIPKTWVQTFVFIILLVMRFSVTRAALISGLCRKAAQQKKKAFIEGGLMALFHRKKGCGRKRKTEKKQKEIVENLENKDYHCAAQMMKMIKELIKDSISIAAVKDFLHKLGYKWLKAGSLPAKADPEKQKEFYEKVELPLMQRAEKKEIALYFLDAAHFILGNGLLGKIWCEIRRWISTNTGRERYNVLGALNFVTKEVLTVTNNTYINALSIIEMLEKLSAIYNGFPVYIILDNAKYQVCNAVKMRAEQLGIKLVYLPPYSPNLNLIERLWKFVKKELSSAYFEKFSDYKANIDLILSKTSTEYREEMQSLIGAKVQLFNGARKKSSSSSELPKRQSKKKEKTLSQPDVAAA